MSDPIYKAQQRSVRDGRLVWYGPASADEAFWTEFWEERIAVHHSSSNAQDVSSVAELDLIEKYLGGKGSVLEAGCGTGQHVATLRAGGYDATGIDYAADLIAQVHEVVPDLPVAAGDVLAIDCEDGVFDCYLSIGVIEHRPEGPDEALVEAFRVTRSGGYAIISVPFFGPIRRIKAFVLRYGKRTSEGLPFFQYAFTRPAFVRHIEAAGFEVVEVKSLAGSRMLEEEIPGYVKVRSLRGGYRICRSLGALVQRRDGHMVVVVARKPSSIR